MAVKFRGGLRNYLEVYVEVIVRKGIVSVKLESGDIGKLVK